MAHQVARPFIGFALHLVGEAWEWKGEEMVLHAVIPSQKNASLCFSVARGNVLYLFCNIYTILPDERVYLRARTSH